MKNVVRMLLLSTILMYMYSCGKPSIPPEFKDRNATLVQLKTKWKCETIEFENWEDDDANDEDLTICLINSKSISNNTPEENSDALKQIGSQIKASLKHPEKYKNYYVIFITEEGNLLGRTRVHTAGGVIPNSDL
jgi:hypothetical protein